MRMTILVLAVILSAGSIIAGARVPTAEEVYGNETANVQIIISCDNCTIRLFGNCNISISGEGGHPCQIITDEQGKMHIECAAPSSNE